MDVFGSALQDYYHRQTYETLWLHTSYGEMEEMPADVFFRAENVLPEIEIYALELCSGKILDIGAGAGCHALLLQQRGYDITALEVSANAAEVMIARGIKNVVSKDIMRYNEQHFDTLIMLMNGIGLAGDLTGLHKLLDHAKTIIRPGGQLLFDSSDVAYLYEDGKFPEDRYYGEISYQYEYNGYKGDWFKWLYIGQKLLSQIAKQHGWRAQIVYEHRDQYLARLVGV